MFNATFKNFLVEEAGVSEENNRPNESLSQTLFHNVVSNTPGMSGVRTHNVNGDRALIT